MSGNQMTARVTWRDGRTFDAASGSGHEVIMDGAPEAGGRDLGHRPMEMLLLGLGGCTAYDVVEILEKSREPVTGVTIEVTGTRADDIPKVYTRVDVKYVIAGKGLDPAKVERAVHLSAEKYCSATIMLGATAEITHDIEIVEG